MNEITMNIVGSIQLLGSLVGRFAATTPAAVAATIVVDAGRFWSNQCVTP